MCILTACILIHHQERLQPMKRLCVLDVMKDLLYLISKSIVPDAINSFIVKLPEHATESIVRLKHFMVKNIENVGVRIVSHHSP